MKIFKHAHVLYKTKGLFHYLKVDGFIILCSFCVFFVDAFFCFFC